MRYQADAATYRRRRASAVKMTLKARAKMWWGRRSSSRLPSMVPRNPAPIIAASNGVPVEAIRCDEARDEWTGGADEHGAETTDDTDQGESAFRNV